MKTIKTRYVMPLIVLLTFPSVLLLFVPSPVLFSFAFAVAVLVSAWVADYSEESPLYESESDVQECVPEKVVEGKVITPCYIWAR